METTKNKWPENPGIYIFWQNHKRIYIGKSVNLKNRLSSYFSGKLGPKTYQMVSSADRVTFIKVTSELESLLLEAYLIKKYKPKYNILLKDDKHALYIEITKEKFPRILTTRKKVGNSTIFGPFPNSTNVKTILKLLRRIFPFSDHKLSKKPCLNSHMGLCNPCPNKIVGNVDENRLRKIYLKNIRDIKLVLSRKFNFLRNSLHKEMLMYSSNEDFEKAKILRDKIQALDYITQNKINEEEYLKNPNLVEDIRQVELDSLSKIIGKSNLKRIECYDIAHISGSKATASMVVAIEGEMEHEYYRHFKIRQTKSQSDYDSMREIAKRRVKHLNDWGTPDLIIVDGGLGQVRIFNEEFKKINILVVGIAKNPDRLIFIDGKKIRLVGNTLNLVSRIRDEAHRFARRYHHRLISKELFK